MLVVGLEDLGLALSIFWETNRGVFYYALIMDCYLQYTDSTKCNGGISNQLELSLQLFVKVSFQHDGIASQVYIYPLLYVIPLLQSLCMNTQQLQGHHTCTSTAKVLTRFNWVEGKVQIGQGNYGESRIHMIMHS